MRDVVFLLADKTMRAMVTAFFRRNGYYKSLGCRAIDFDPDMDTVVPGNDPAVYHQASGLLRTYRQTHANAVVMIDNEWSGSPGPEHIRSGIENALLNSGWARASFVVLVLDPELEAWFWQWDNPNIEAAVWPSGRTRGALPAMSLWDWLAEQGLWQPGEPKPERPKEALERALRLVGRPWSSAIHSTVAENVSTRGCRDQAFQSLCEALRTWFPPDEP